MAQLGFIVIKAGTDGNEDILQGYSLRNNKMIPSFTKDKNPAIGRGIALFTKKVDAWQAVEELQKQGVPCHIEQVLSGYLQSQLDKLD